MDEKTSLSGSDRALPILTWRAVVLAALGYLVCLAIATDPVMRNLGRGIPGGGSDPAIHLWTLRWYERCLLEGELPFRCEGLNAPVGISTGQNPALHLPAILFLTLRFVTTNDTLRYDLIWMFGFLTTGLGTAWLALRVVKDRLSAWLAGLLAMLSAPMLLHGHGHIELIQLGSVPLFLGAWLAWLERPGRGRFLGAVGAYLLVAMSAQYFALMTIAPAIVMLTWIAKGSSDGMFGWLRRRWGGLAGFGLLSLHGISLLYVSQLLAIVGGMRMERLRSEFDAYGVPWWAYVIPIPGLGFERAVALNWWTPEYGARVVEIGSYQGIVMLALLAVSMMGRVRFDRRWMWWSLLALSCVLSFGSALKVGGWTVPMPSSWLYDLFPPVRLTRVPGRYNLFVVVFGAVIASVALRAIFSRLPRSGMKGVCVVGLAILVILDLGRRPFPLSELEGPPEVYASLAARNPGSTLLEVPQYDTHGGPEALELSGMLSYWQATHRLQTTAGYTAVANLAYEWRLGHTSPFLDRLVRQGDYAMEATIPALDLMRSVSLLDLAWMYSRSHQLDFIVVHRWWAERYPYYRDSLDRLCQLLEPAKVLEGDGISVFATEALPKPRVPVALPTEGWGSRVVLEERFNAGLTDQAIVAVFNPDAAQPLVLTIEARSRKRPSRVRLKNGSSILAEWVIAPRRFEPYLSPPFRLPEGLSELVVELDEADRTPSSRSADPVRVSQVLLKPSNAPEIPIPGTLANSASGRDEAVHQ